MKLPVLNLSTATKWLLFAATLLVTKGPKLVELMTGTQFAPYVHYLTLAIGVVTLLMTQQNAPKPSTPVTP